MQVTILEDHTRLQSIDQVVECLEAINEALARVRHDPTAQFCGFDNQGHCLLLPATQRRVAALWQNVLAPNMNIEHSGAGRRELSKIIISSLLH